MPEYAIFGPAPPAGTDDAARFLFLLRRANIMKAKKMPAITAIPATPAPIPALAPVLRPLLSLSPVAPAPLVCPDRADPVDDPAGLDASVLPWLTVRVKVLCTVVFALIAEVKTIVLTTVVVSVSVYTFVIVVSPDVVVVDRSVTRKVDITVEAS
jgi:hypothetical protein